MKIKLSGFLPSVGGMVALFLLGTVFAGEPKVKGQDPAIFFWYHFRTAVTTNNLPKLQGLTLFPFETTTDGARGVKNSKAKFALLYRTLLDTPGQEGKTMRDLISAKEDLTNDERDALNNGEIQIGSFHFRSIKKKCFFVGADLSVTKNPLPKTPPPPPESAVPVPPEKSMAVLLPSSVDPEPTVQQTVEGELIHLAASPPKTRPPVPLPHSSEPAVEKHQETVFRFFWVEFRKAVLDNDVAAIKSLTRFPFETKGPLEDDPKKKFVAREFDLLWPRLLETDPHSWGPLRDSMKELIERREEPSVEEISTEPSGLVQVGVFVFRKIKNRWVFTRAIVTE
jgi:hypothetical protein